MNAAEITHPMASEPPVDLEAGTTAPESPSAPGSENTPSPNDAATDDHPDGLVEMVKHPWGIAMSLYWALSACLSLVISNTAIIISGHLLLRYCIPLPSGLLPALLRAFIVSNLTSTLAMAALGTAVLAIPVFASGMVVVGFTIGMKMGSLVVLRTIIHLSQTVRSSRPMLPHPDTLFYQAWMVSAGPIGSLIYEILYPDAKNHLSTVEMLIAAALPRAFWLGNKYARRALAPPMPELRPADAPPGVHPHLSELRPADTTEVAAQAEQSKPLSEPEAAAPAAPTQESRIDIYDVTGV